MKYEDVEQLQAAVALQIEEAIHGLAQPRIAYDIEMDGRRFGEWVKTHKSNLGPYTEDSPCHCLDCGKSWPWKLGEACAVQRSANPAFVFPWNNPFGPPQTTPTPSDGIWHRLSPEDIAVVEPKGPRCGHDGFKLESKKGYMCSRSFLCGHTWEDTP